MRQLLCSLLRWAEDLADESQKLPSMPTSCVHVHVHVHVHVRVHVHVHVRVHVHVYMHALVGRMLRLVSAHSRTLH